MLIAQLSDLHVRPHGVLYQDVADSNGMFVQALQQLERLDVRPDLLLLSGDLVDQGTAAEYGALRDLLARCTLPCLVVPGNHDEREAFRSAFDDHSYLPADGPLHWCVDHHPVRVVGLDSSVPGRHHGAIDPAGLDWLADTLAADPHRPTLVMLHHPPFPCGIPYLDRYGYPDPARLEQVLAAAPGVELIVCGHVHRTMMRAWAGAMVVTCPSSTTQIDLQFLPDAPPRSHVGPRGGLLHRRTPSNGWLTHVIDFGDFDGPYGFA